MHDGTGAAKRNARTPFGSALTTTYAVMIPDEVPEKLQLDPDSSV